MFLFQAFLLAILFTVGNGNIFTSCHKLRKMALAEDRILSKFKEHIDQQRAELDALSDAYESLVEESRLKHSSDALSDLNHPNGLYYVIKRFAMQYKNLLGKYLVDLRDKLRKDEDPIQLADDADFDGALRALLRLQEVYNLTAWDMVQGNYKGYYGPELGFEDAYFIGRVAFIDAKLHMSLDWLTAALQLRREDPDVVNHPRKAPTVGAIKGLIGRAFVLLKRFQEAQDIFVEAYADDQNSGDVLTLKNDIKQRRILTVQKPNEAQANYSRLCQHEGPYHIESPDYKAMKCRYKPSLVPYYAFKEEILSISPYVSLFYNVVTEKDRKHLMENVYNTLARGLVGSGIGTDLSTYSNIRTSDVAWLSDSNNAKTASLSRRVDLITGLAVDQIPDLMHPRSAEDFQVVNYGLAGHYEVHLDPFHIPDGSGFRIATFLMYLNSVMKGGSTVFTKAGISVSPNKFVHVKGPLVVYNKAFWAKLKILPKTTEITLGFVDDTVLFWYSFPPAFDQVDDLTHHAGCPVLIGQKWIANKWIRSYGNSYRRPCGLKPNQTQLDIEKTMSQNQRNIFTTLKS